MATARILMGKSRVVAYMPDLRAAVRHFRAFSSYGERKPANRNVLVDNAVDSLQENDCPLGILAPRDSRFPMPGMQGPVGQVEATHNRHQQLPPAVPEILSEPLPAERQIGMLGQYIIASRRMDDEGADHDSQLTDEHHSASVNKLECVAVECPDLLKREFMDLFPERNLHDSALTVITMSQKTQHDMSGWSPAIEDERELLLENFVSAAQDICQALKEAGFWADFIDPSSGRPFYGPFTNATLFETDERYRQLGFEIDDLGCCRVISHHVWGKHAYVGCIFTDATTNNPIITDMIKDPAYK